MKATITSPDVSLLTTRITLGIIVGAHGVQKLFGWFGGYGFDGTMHFFTETIGLPYVVGVLIIMAETAGMLMLITGLFSRILALALVGIMSGAIATTHSANGFFMNWGGTLPGEGYEFHLLVTALALPVILQGAGQYSLDYLVFIKPKTRISGAMKKSYKQ